MNLGGAAASNPERRADVSRTVLEEVSRQTAEISGAQFRRCIVLPRTPDNPRHRVSLATAHPALSEPTSLPAAEPCIEGRRNMQEDVYVLTEHNAHLPHPDLRNMLAVSPRAVADKLQKATGRFDVISYTALFPVKREMPVRHQHGMDGVLEPCNHFHGGSHGYVLRGPSVRPRRPDLGRGRLGR